MIVLKNISVKNHSLIIKTMYSSKLLAD